MIASSRTRPRQTSKVRPGNRDLATELSTGEVLASTLGGGVPILGAMDVPDRHALDKHTARQLGLFTRVQATTCGFSVGQITRRLKEGDWVEVRRGVLAERGLARTAKVRDMSVLLCVPGAILAGPSALRWHGVD